MGRGNPDPKFLNNDLLIHGMRCPAGAMFLVPAPLDHAIAWTDTYVCDSAAKPLNYMFSAAVPLNHASAFLHSNQLFDACLLPPSSSSLPCSFRVFPHLS